MKTKPLNQGYFVPFGFILLLTAYWGLIKLVVAMGEANAAYFDISELNAFLWFFGNLGLVTLIASIPLLSSKWFCTVLFSAVFISMSAWSLPFNMDITGFSFTLVAGFSAAVSVVASYTLAVFLVYKRVSVKR